MSPARRWLKLQAAGSSARLRSATRAWLRRHRGVAAFLERAGCLNVDELTLARGVAVGLFIGLTPTLGVQTALMLGASVLLRANFPAAFAASWINNPLTFAPLYLGFHQLGEQVTAFLPVRFDSLSGLEEEIAEETLSLVIGSLCIALPGAVLGYFGFLYVWRRFDLHLPGPSPRHPGSRVDKAPGDGQHPG